MAYRFRCNTTAEYQTMWRVRQTNAYHKARGFIANKRRAVFHIEWSQSRMSHPNVIKEIILVWNVLAASASQSRCERDPELSLRETFLDGWALSPSNASLRPLLGESIRRSMSPYGSPTTDLCIIDAAEKHFVICVPTLTQLVLARHE